MNIRISVVIRILYYGSTVCTLNRCSAGIDVTWSILITKENKQKSDFNVLIKNDTVTDQTRL